MLKPTETHPPAFPIFSIYAISLEWIVGRKKICQKCGGMSWDTIKRWHKEHGFPLIYLPGGTPAALPQMLDYWLVERMPKEK